MEKERERQGPASERVAERERERETEGARGRHDPHILTMGSLLMTKRFAWTRCPW